MNTAAVFDTCGIVPTPEVMEHWFRVIAGNQAYLRVFWRGFAHWAGLTKQEYFRVFDRGHKEAVEYLAGRIGNTRTISADAFVKQMDDGGVETMVLHNGHYKTSLGLEPVPFEYQAELARKYPGRFKLLAGVDPLAPNSADTLSFCVKELGYSGLLVVPFFHRLRALDDCWQPLFRRCQELGVPAWVHSTANWNPEIPYDASSPKVIDQLAIAYPRLKIMAGHAGWPWVHDMMVVAWRHPNVYVEVSAFRPKSMADPGYGFGPLLYFGAGPLRNKIMFGSTWHMLNLPLRQIFQEVRDLPVSKEITQQWVYRNAAALFAS